MATATADSSPTLSAAERDRLTALERLVAREQGAFVAVGRALMEIRDRELYRATHRSFERYLRDRWDLSYPRGFELIRSSQIAAAIEADGGPPPRSEAVVRPLGPILTRDGPTVAARTWREIAERHNGNGRLTAADVRSLLVSAGSAVGSTATRSEPLDIAGRLLLQAGKYVERLGKSGLDVGQRAAAGRYAMRAQRLAEGFRGLAVGSGVPDGSLSRRYVGPDEPCAGHGRVRDEHGVCVLCERKDLPRLPGR